MSQLSKSLDLLEYTQSTVAPPGGSQNWHHGLVVGRSFHCKHSEDPELWSAWSGSLLWCTWSSPLLWSSAVVHLVCYSPIDEGPSKPKWESNGDAATSKALIGSQISCQRVRATQPQNRRNSNTCWFVWDDAAAVYFLQWANSEVRTSLCGGLTTRRRVKGNQHERSQCEHHS